MVNQLVNVHLVGKQVKLKRIKILTHLRINHHGTSGLNYYETERY